MGEPKIRVCAVENTLDARDTRWNRTALTWSLKASLPSLTLAAVRSCARQAFAQWAAVSGMSFTETEGPADIVMEAGRLDGPGGVLAWSNLPPAAPCAQRYDDGENWTPDARGAAGPIDLVAVMTHEIGHALGLQHDGEGSGSLMAPYYSPRIRTPQANDVKRIQALYGPPRTLPTPTGGSVITIVITDAESISIPGYTVTRNP